MPKGETEIASTAGAGSLLVEFATLSYLTGDYRYEQAAAKAVRALHERRSSIGLLGKHIHVKNGKWSEAVSGIGSNSDSYYEYLLKAYLLDFASPSTMHSSPNPDFNATRRHGDMLRMFTDCFAAIKRHVQDGDWFGDVDMHSGKVRRNRVENLHAFWPGMEALLGFTESASALLNALYSVWDSIGFLPEEMDQVK